MNQYKISIICLAVLFWLTGETLAQQYMGQRGRLLDANMRLGGTGRNQRNVMSFNYRPDSNLFITGNVTGGSRFQGTIPYRSDGEFQGGLGIRPMDSFRRDSTGLESLTNSFMGGPMPYVDPSRSVTRSSGNAITNTSTVNLTRPASSSRFALPGGLQPDRLTQFNTQVNTNKFNQSMASPTIEFNPMKPNSDGLEMPVAGDGNARISLNSMASRLNTTVPLQMDNERVPLYGDVYAPRTRAADSSMPSVLLPGEMRVSLSGMGDNDAAPATTATGQPGVNLTHRPTVQLAYKSSHLDDNLSPVDARQKTAAGVRAPNARVAMHYDYQRAAQSKTKLFYDKASGEFDRGDYAAAAATLKLALIYAPDDPAIHLARVHALLAEGDLLAAGFELNRALTDARQMPQLNAGTLVLAGKDELRQKRLAELDVTLADRPQPVLILVKAYLHHLDRQPVLAREQLNRAELKDAKLGGTAILLQAVEK